MPTPWDHTLKSLVEENPQALVSFLLAGAVYKGELNRELITRAIVADVLYQVDWDGEPIVLHVEFQSSRKSNMPRRVWEYHCLTSIITKMPVYSVVIYPVKKSITQPVYRPRFRNGQVIHVFPFQQIKLWELTPEVFEQPQLVGLLPLLPLTKDGQNRETVDRMIDKMERAGKKNILWVAKTIAGLVLESVEDKEWITERFKPVLDDLLKESWVYQETIEEGRKRGIEQGVKQDREQVILRFVELRFPSLLVLAKRAIERGMSLEQLQSLNDKLYVADTAEEVTTALHACEMEQ